MSNEAKFNMRMDANACGQFVQVFVYMVREEEDAKANEDGLECSQHAGSLQLSPSLWREFIDRYGSCEKKEHKSALKITQTEAVETLVAKAAGVEPVFSTETTSKALAQMRAQRAAVGLAQKHGVDLVDVVRSAALIARCHSAGIDAEAVLRHALNGSD